jgi:thioesterase domain-containing protein
MEPQTSLDRPCTVLNPGGHLTPVFFFHGDLLGGGMFCKSLAGALGPDRPFYVVNPHGLEGDAIPPTLEAMAADRLKWIRQVQPHGPYIIGGYCHGALLAHHTARFLRDAGEPVAAVLMLCADGSNVRFRFLRRLIALRGALREENAAAQRKRFLRIRNRLCDLDAMRCYYMAAAGELWKQPIGVQVSRIWRKTRRVLRRFSPAALKNLAKNFGSPCVEPAPPRHKEAIVNAYEDILQDYIPVTSDSPAYLFWPVNEPPATRRGPACGWNQICTQVELVDVPGDHTSCVSQSANVTQIGDAMRKSIQQAESLLTQK